MEIIDQLQNVFRRVFDDDRINISRTMTAADVEDWDSLNHVLLVTAIEREFKLRFTIGEVTRLKNVGDLIDLVEQKKDQANP
ncbi:MAG: acyl carrier protein [Oligoflexales bacterium]|nr:acyl carrier protein [Oligoflexales bacterium]